jgi:hypothetical protein
MKLVCAGPIVLFVAFAASGQSKERPVLTHRGHKVTWQLFAPRGVGFSISVPAKPQRIRDWISDNDPNGYESIDAFGGEYRRRHAAFAVVALLPSAAMLKEDGDRNELKGLEFLIGGDDAEPASRLPIKVNGLTGTEFVYHFPEEGRHVRGRVIDGGRRVFVLIYGAKAAASLNSATARRFFDSLKLARAVRSETFKVRKANAARPRRL